MWLFRISLLLAFLLQYATAEQPEEAAPETKATETQPEEDAFDPKEHTDWGTYHDPQNVFCGKFDCYKILGFDYESFGSTPPSRKEITQRYRTLSRVWHPDKNKKNKDAKQKFVKIARAYEVLTDKEQRAEYDFMRYNQEAYFQKYGASILWTYAPQSDTIGVVISLLVISTAVAWALQKQKWQQVANKLIRACVEDWGPREGGTPESKHIREQAMEILEKQKEQEAEANGDSPTKKNKKGKSTPTERRKAQQDALRPIVTEIVDKMEDFGAGFHKPTWRDLLVIRLAYVPYYLFEGITWNLKYMFRRLLKKELNDEERERLTIRAVGDIAWHSASEEERESWIHRDLWVVANMVDWEEEQQVKFLSPGDQKRYARMKKKGKKLGDMYDKEE